MRNDRDRLGWETLPRAAQTYVTMVIALGACLVIALFPRTLPNPAAFTVLVLASCLTSTWKVNLPISLVSGSTLSVSYAANLSALILRGPRAAILVAIAGAWAQCSFNTKQSYPFYRTAFSIAAEAITMIASGYVYVSLGGAARPAPPPPPPAPPPP